VAADARLIIRKDFRNHAAVDEAFKDCEIVFGNIEPDWVTSAPRLRWMQLESVGFGEYRNVDWAALDHPVIVTNLAGFFAAPVAQTALAGILALLRGIDRLVLYRRQRHWEGDPLRSRLHTLNAAQVVLFGYGAINRELEKLLAAFDCGTVPFNSDWHNETLDTALRQADIVVAAVPETDRTVAVFDARRLALLGEHALFVNCGRGSVVDENALADALRTGRLAGAVLDVTLAEPLPDDHAFWSTPNTILTQHSGGGTADELDRKIDVFAANLRRYRSNQPLRSIADFERGY
jgi:phosphoglycerate dehydrogenase-like enzyme